MRTKFKFLVGLPVILLMFTIDSSAQGPIDGFFSEKGDASISLSYSYANYDEFLVGGVRAPAVPAHNEIDQTIYNLYVKYGITDKVTVIANLPYIGAEGNGVADPVNGSTEQSDFQDISVFVKWSPYTTQLTHGSMSYIVALGGSVPLGYEPNGILSLGSGAPGIDAKLGLHYQNDSGFFGTVLAGYGLRGSADNNIGTGDGAEFDVPNIANALFKVGYAAKAFYVDAWLDAQTSLSGVDIMGEGFTGNFPETNVGFSRVGANLFVPFTSAIGASVGVGSVIDGRNIGLTTYYTGGITVNL